MANPARFPQTGFRGTRRGRQHRAHARDLAHQGRIRVVRVARWQGARPELGADCKARRAPGTRLDRVQPEHRVRRGAEGDRARRRGVLRAAHDAGALRPRVRDEPDARADQLAARDLRVGPARRPRVLRSGRRGRAVPPLVRRRALRRRCSCRPPGKCPNRLDRQLARGGLGVQSVGARGKGVGGGAILEFGSGAAGPIATRYFVEHGATVLRIESKTRPDFLRMYALGPEEPARSRRFGDVRRLERRQAEPHAQPQGAGGVALVRRLVVEWADAVAENFAPRAMKAFGLDYDALAEHKPDLVMISACLNGQTGPHKDYPGLRRPRCRALGLQRADRLAGPRAGRPVRHDHRFARPALRRDRARRRAALPPAHRPRRVPRRLPGGDRHLVARTVVARLRDRRRDPSCATATITRTPRCTARSRAPTRTVSTIAGSRSHAGATRSSNASTASPARTSQVGRGLAPAPRSPRSSRPPGSRLSRCTTSGTCTVTRSSRTAGTSSRSTIPFLGDGLYERNGFRLGAVDGGYDRAGPTLGQDNDWALGRRTRSHGSADRGIARYGRGGVRSQREGPALDRRRPSVDG